MKQELPPSLFPADAVFTWLTEAPSGPTHSQITPVWSTEGYCILQQGIFVRFGKGKRDACLSPRSEKSGTSRGHVTKGSQHTPDTWNRELRKLTPFRLPLPVQLWEGPTPPPEWPCPSLKTAALTIMAYCKGVEINGQQTGNITRWNGPKKKKEPELSNQHKPVKTKGYFGTENKWKVIRQIQIKRTLVSNFNIKQQFKEKKHDEGSRGILNMKK